MYKKISLLLLLTLSLLTLSACGKTAAPTTPTPPPPESKGTVQIVYVEWVCATASSHVIADVLTRQMGYEVELTPVSAALMFEALAGGDADVCTTAWLPVTHEAYMDKIGDRVDDLGLNAIGAKLALTVPAYVDIDSIADLPSIRDDVGGEIIGIDPGAGIMTLTEKAIDSYNLDYSLVASSDGAMTAALKAAIDREEPIVVTGWMPHWMYSRWDLKMLEDPQLIMGETEEIHTIARLGLKEDMPEVYAFLDNFNWTIDQLNEAILMADASGDSVAAARQWVDENPELVKSWLPE